MKWDKDKVFRTTKCFSPRTNGYPGGFPVGFLKYVQDNGWWGENRAYLCAGMVDDPKSVRVDIRSEVHPTHCEDARRTSLQENSFDCVIVDPPYSAELAERLYDTKKVFASVNAFTKEAERICEPGGIIISLSYEVPKRLPNSDIIAVIGVYQVMSVAHMRALVVWKKREIKEVL